MAGLSVPLTPRICYEEDEHCGDDARGRNSRGPLPTSLGVGCGGCGA
jgi:hypothetical protein